MPRILVIENNTTLGAFISLDLIDGGYEVSKVGDPSLVAERLLENAPDLIIFNTGLPSREKAEFIGAWRQLSSTVKVLELSENPLIVGRDGEDPNLIAAPDGFLGIPFQFNELEEAVATTLSPTLT